MVYLQDGDDGDAGDASLEMGESLWNQGIQLKHSITSNKVSATGDSL